MTTRILIADDEPIIRMNLRETLQEQGYLVVGEVGDGQSAVNLTRQLRPDIALLDVKMPHLDGISAARSITAETLAPVLLLTAYSSRELVSEAREAGVLGYLIKPIREAELMPLIEVAIARWAERTQRSKELNLLKDRLETRKMIERAKGCLMDQQGLNEADAFRKIQQLAMNSRKTMREVAQAILLTRELGA
ncbi:ANTAR domain-containing response regulator [Candidatus Viridilinea mediisalina]|uniref:Response regulator n=1 Tax=Candidatus Viridilinea mediisalina TaxID=2024553 RepID=A0A2A6REV9_9CHLR|nr:response regulator [Candidatus Viridilinea mediisalina]PDW01607.1 response regulator [Candidatus Viridilinea mediisalina]